MAKFAFDRFVLDQSERLLTANGQPVDINGRYFDALALMVREHGKLVTKDRFMAEVWRSVPVTDEALTQCVRSLRRELGDNASSPRFIETVPKHGYRFVGRVVESVAGGAPPQRDQQWSRFVQMGTAGTLGAALAGMLGGLIYGLAAASQPGIGAISMLLVMLSLTMLVAVIGGGAVSFAIGTIVFAQHPSWLWHMLSGAAGGLVVGAFGKLLGSDAFTLLAGTAPGAITGPVEGALLGAAAGLAAWIARRARSVGRGVAIGAAAGGVAGILVALLGGRMMLGSLALAAAVPGSRLEIEPITRLFGEDWFGPISHVSSSALEGALFTGFLVGGLLISARRGR